MIGLDLDLVIDLQTRKVSELFCYEYIILDLALAIRLHQVIDLP